MTGDGKKDEMRRTNRKTASGVIHAQLSSTA
jgi:hypothetical protein